MVKLILADNQAIFRAGIAKVLAVEDDMRIVAQAQTLEQLLMAIDKFRTAVVVVASNFHPDLAPIAQASTKSKTRIIVLADTGETSSRFLGNGANGRRWSRKPIASSKPSMPFASRRTSNAASWTSRCRPRPQSRS